MILRYPLLARLLMVAALLGPALRLSAQEGMYNNGQVIHVSSGTLMFVGGPVDNAGTGSITNHGTLELQDDYVNHPGAKYNPGIGQVVCSGSGIQNFTMNGDTISALVLNKTAQADYLYINGGPMVVRDNIAFNIGTVVSTSANYLRLDLGGSYTGGSSVSYVSGPMDLQQTGDVIWPVGDATEFRPVTLYNVQTGGTTPILRFEAIPNAGPAPGTDGLGAANRSGQHVWLGSLVSGSYTGADSIGIGYGPDDTNGSIGAFSASKNQIIANSATLNGAYTSLGSGYTDIPLANGLITSDSLMGTQLGYFTLGECGGIPGTAFAQTDTICIGSTAMVYSQNAEAGTYQWYRSSDSTTFTSLAGTNNDSLFLSDTLSAKTFFRMAVSTANCYTGYSNITKVVLRPAISMRLRAMLEGPYNTTTHKMNSGATGLQSSHLLSNMYEYSNHPASLRPDTLMHPGHTLPDTVVDKVAIELYRDTDSDGYPDLKVDSTLGWVTQNGEIINFFDATATSPLRFCSAQSQSYFVVLRHRNHLGVMSDVAKPLTQGGASTTLDFTDPVNVYNGSFELVQVETGVWALFGGNLYDEPAVGDVNLIDASDLFEAHKGIVNLYSGYVRTDVNLDGLTNPLDYAIVSRNNNMLVYTSVPF